VIREQFLLFVSLRALRAPTTPPFFFQICNLKSTIVFSIGRLPHLLPAKSHSPKGRAPTRKPRHILRQLLLGHRRRKAFQTHPPRRRRQSSLNIASGPVRVSFPLMLPDKQQPLILKFDEHLFQPFDSKGAADR